MSDKFEHPSLDKLYAVLEVIENAEQVIRDAKETLYPIIAEIPLLIGDNEDLRDEIFHYLYWHEDRVPATALMQAFQIKLAAHAKKNAIEKIMKNGYIEAVCCVCEQNYCIEVKSRTDMKRR